MHKHLHEVYPNPQSKRESRLGAREPEQEIGRIYGLYRMKLSPNKLRLISAVNIAVILVVMGALTAGVLFLPKAENSMLEQRSLTKWPQFSFESLFSGAYTDQIRNYVADTFPLRERFVGLAASLEQSWGLRIDDVRIVAGGGQEPDAQSTASENGKNTPASSPQIGSVNQMPQQDPAETPSASSSTLEQSRSSSSSTVQTDVEGFVHNGIFIAEGRAMSLFGGNPSAGKRYASTLSAFQQAMPQVQVYNMIVPTASEFLLPQKYASLSGSQKDMIDTIYNALDSSIKTVDVYGELQQHLDEYLYFNTDHHWTGLGAYYAYKAFCETAGLTPVPLADMEKRTLTNFVGTMYSQSQDATLLANPDYVDYYIPSVEYTAYRYDRGSPYVGKTHLLWGEYAKSPNSYSVFLQGDFPLIHVITENKNGRKLLMVKESFGNAVAPFFINHYEEVFVVDQRYFERPLKSFIEEHEVDDLVFVNNTFATCTAYHIDCINTLNYGHVYTPPVQATPTPTPTPVPMHMAIEEERPRLGSAVRNRSNYR